MAVSIRGRKRYELANHLGNVSAVISDKKLMSDNLDGDGIADEFRADVRTAQDYYAFGSPRYDRKAKLPTTTEVIVCRIRVHRFEMNDCIQIVIPPVLTEDVTNSYCYDNAIPLEQALQELVSQFTFNSSYVATVEGTDIILKTTVANLENLRYCDFPVRVAVTQGTAKAEVIDAYQCPEAYRYAFNGKEQDKEVYGEDNAYDFGARMYDARIGRWFTTDPLATKYPFFSPYAAFGDNPIYYVDPSGETLRVARSAQSTFNVLLQSVSYKQVVSILENSSINYVIEDLSTGELPLGAGGSLSTDGNTVYINFQNSGSEFIKQRSLAEETNHALQFDNGDLGFVFNESSGRWRPNFALDIVDELRAHDFGDNVMNEVATNNSPNMKSINSASTVADIDYNGRKLMGGDRNSIYGRDFQRWENRGKPLNGIVNENYDGFVKQQTIKDDKNFYRTPLNTDNPK